MKQYLSDKKEGQDNKRKKASSSLAENQLKGKEIITKKQIESMEKLPGHRKVKVDIEKDLFNLILKFRKELMEEAEKIKKKKTKGNSLQ